MTNHEAAKEVQSSKRSTANTVWWGFNEDDATDALQAAVRSGAKHVIGPNFSKDRMVCPLQLVSDQELVLEPGVTITAQRGAYRGGGRQHPQCRRVVRICEAKLASR